MRLIYRSAIGMAVSSLWMTQYIVLSIFLAWAIKHVVLRYGGISQYRALRPFFVGLIAGFFLGVGISFAVDAIWFFGMGHFIHNG